MAPCACRSPSWAFTGYPPVTLVLHRSHHLAQGGVLRAEEVPGHLHAPDVFPLLPFLEEIPARDPVRSCAAGRVHPEAFGVDRAMAEAGQAGHRPGPDLGFQ